MNGPASWNLEHGIFAAGRTWVLLLSVLAVHTPAWAGDAALADAIRHHRSDVARALLSAGADLRATLPDGSTALHWAIHWDDLELTALLVRGGADVDAADDYGVTPLLLAAENGSAAAVGALLERGSDPNLALPGGETALMTAARTGRIDVVQALIARGAVVDARESTRGQTALMWAAAEGQVEVIRLLVERRADVHARSRDGYTPLLFAARDAAPETTTALLAAGADINEAATDGTTALLIALIRGRLDYARTLIELGADPNRGPGHTPLHWVAGEWNGELSTSVAADSEWSQFGGLRGAAKLAWVQRLLAHGADPNARVSKNIRRFGGAGGNAGSLVGATPLLLAAASGDVAVMNALLAAGADPRATTDSGTTALMLAAGLAHAPGITPVSEADALDAVKVAVERGNPIDAANAAGDTALHAAAFWGADEIVRFLVSRGADVDATDKKLWTPLVIAEGIYQGGGVKYFHSTAALLRTLGARPSPPDIDRANGGLIAADRRR
jgi:ankyrin repeat protein